MSVIVVAVCHSRLLFFNFTLFFILLLLFFFFWLFALQTRFISHSFVLSFSKVFYRLHTWHEYSLAWTRNPWCLCDYNNFVILHYRPLSAFNCMNDISSINVQFFSNLFFLTFCFNFNLQSSDSIVIITSLSDTSTFILRFFLQIYFSFWFLWTFLSLFICLLNFFVLLRLNFYPGFLSRTHFNLLDHFRKSQATCIWLWLRFSGYGNFNICIMCIFATVEFPLTELISKSTFKSLCAHELRPYSHCQTGRQNETRKTTFHLFSILMMMCARANLRHCMLYYVLMTLMPL